MAVEAFQELVSLQGDVQQADQHLDSAGRLQEDRSDRQRRLPLMVESLEIVLFLVLCEQGVGASGDGGGGDQGGQAVVAVIGFGGGGIAAEIQPVGGSAKASARRGQCGLFLGGQRDEVPGKTAGRVAFSQKLGDLTLDTGESRRGMSALDFGGEFLEAGSELGNVLEASLLALGGVGTALARIIHLN